MSSALCSRCTFSLGGKCTKNKPMFPVVYTCDGYLNFANSNAIEELDKTIENTGNSNVVSLLPKSTSVIVVPKQTEFRVLSATNEAKCICYAKLP